MNRKGFTLIELLAVIVILGAISSIAVMGIRKSLTNRETRELTEQKELAKNAAKIYFSLNNVSKTNGVLIATLKKQGYFNDTSKTDKLGAGDCIKYKDGVYNYIKAGNCSKAYNKNDLN